MNAYRAPVAGLLLALLSSASPQVRAQADLESDRALAGLISRFADRRSIDLPVASQADGSMSVDLQGRYQHVMLGQLGGSGEVMLGCVTSLAEANRFLGRNLETGERYPQSKAGEADAELIETARQHGMSVAEFRFYSDLIDQSAPLLLAPTASTFTIVNNDGAGEGFNSAAAPFLPAPGNTGATLGQQRLQLFNAAAAVWSAFLDSSITVQVGSQFNSLTPCTTSGGVLGSAGTTTIHGNFPNAIFTNTWYHQALANKLRGADSSGAQPDLDATFNSDVDTGCLGVGTRFYYGLDNATPAGTINLFVVLLHEIGHGIGFSSFTDEATGQFFSGFPDVWARFQFDRDQGLTWFQMPNDAARAASAINNNDLLWDGPNVRIASGFLTLGRDAATGRVELYTPATLEPGSSVSHYNTRATPNLLMEPAINTGLPLTLDLTRQLTRDIGWYRDTTADLVADTITTVAPSGGSLAVGANTNITWTNTGGFARNVTIELSTDGGTTFPTAIATDVANTGTRAWTVPNSPTTQARIRVREHDFAAPAGVSAANFTIGAGNTAPTFTPAGAIARQQGSAAGSAVTVGTVADAETAAGSLIVTQVAGGTATGITVAGITNTAGTVAATLAASCSATTGTVRFQVSDGSLNGTGDLQLNVSANTAPVLTYANASVAGGGGTTVNPATGPGDNGSVASVVVQSDGTYTGTISVNAAGVVTLSNAAPIGTHTITIRATDNCGTITDATFQLQVTNTAPTFTPAGAIARQQGSAAGAAVTVGTVADAQTAAGSLTVTQVAGGTATGISVAGITNTAGTVAAALAASCSATTGTVRFQVSDGSLNGTGDLQLNVSANTAPTLTYLNASVVGGAGTTVNPATGPSDNGSVTTVAVQSAGTYTGTISVNAAGVVTLSNAAPVGTHTITIRATDNCTTTTDASFQLQVTNTAPSFTPAGAIARQQGSAAGAAVTVGTVADAQTAAGSLTVTQVAGGTATGITVAGITNTAGTVAATLAASCSATTGTIRFQVSDGSLNGTGDLQLNVSANTAPVLTYANASVVGGGGNTVNPATGPSDNGSVSTVAVQGAGTYTGTISVDAAGIVTLSNAAPLGTHTITIRATDNCGTVTDATFQLQVTNTAPTFTPAGAIARQQGSAAGAAVTVGTVADAQTTAGSLTVTQVAGGTAAGITVAGITNTAGTVAATLAASCSATSGTVRFQVSDGNLNGTGDLQLNVNANSAPTLTYLNASVVGGAGTTVNPATGPVDNGSVSTVAVQGTGTYTGTISVNAAGVVTLSNAAPLGTHTITIRATDDCGAVTDATFSLQVTNTAPGFTPAGAIARQQGSAAGAAVTIGTVTDAQTPAGSLTVTQVAGGTASGISVAGITNTAGTVAATLAASCIATTGTVRFQVSDGGLNGNGDLQLDVAANTNPVLAYANQSVGSGGGAVIDPASGPGDNGLVATVVVQSPGTYTGSISVDAAGVVTLANAAPSGAHTITIRATDNCAASTDASFALAVGADGVFANGFE